MKLTEDFSDWEFECSCPQQCSMKDGAFINRTLLKKLQSVRTDYGKSISITSGLRCADHNRKVGGKVTSSHIAGSAIDIECKASGDRAKLLRLLVPVFRRIGIGKDFIHVDVDASKAQDVIWVYP